MDNWTSIAKETVRIEALDFAENFVGQLEGYLTAGSLSVAGNAPVRRTLSLSLFLADTTAINLIGINRKFRAFLQVDGKESCLGIFVATGVNVQESNVSITAMDKMALLNGTVSGFIEGLLYADKVIEVDDEGNEVEKKMTMEEIIYYVVAGLGGERRERILISDVPAKIRTPLVYEGPETLYFDADGNEASEANHDYKIEYGDYAGYKFSDFIFPSDLIFNPGTPLTAVLDTIIQSLGNYEYFYDIDGNFIFQEQKNFVNTQFKNYTALENGDYLVDLRRTPYVKEISDEDNTLIGLSSAPNWNLVKNNFIVWGTASGVGKPVMYHLAVDSKPKLPAGETMPWQQFLINRGATNLTDPGPYYSELKSRFPEIYDAEKKEWKGDRNSWNYYFDMVDSEAEYSQFSIGEIGKRTHAITDDKVGSLFPIQVPDWIITDDPSELDDLYLEGYKVILVSSDVRALFKEAPYTKDALSVVREALFNYTTAIQQVNVTSRPDYSLEPNTMVSINSPKNNVYGEFMINSISYGFGGTMNLALTQVAKRT